MRLSARHFAIGFVAGFTLGVRSPRAAALLAAALAFAACLAC
jgi:hypothetical protein